MRILDENGNEVLNPDFAYGYYVEDTIVTAHHEAQEYIPEQFHYEVVAEYPNGGRDVERVIDVPGQEARDAWDETETILRWHPYSQEEIEARDRVWLIDELVGRVDTLTERMDNYEDNTLAEMHDMKDALEILGVSE